MNHPRRVVLSLVVAILSAASLAASQDSAPPANPGSASSSSSSSAGSSSKPARRRPAWADEFLIHGSVFTDKGLVFPGVQIRVRRVGEKKFRWQDASDSRGDFAIRVPKNASYEVFMHAKGFVDQSKTVNAQSGLTDETLSFEMQPAGGKK